MILNVCYQLSIRHRDAFDAPPTELRQRFAGITPDGSGNRLFRDMEIAPKNLCQQAPFCACVEVSQAAHLSLGVFQRTMCAFVSLCALDNRELVLNRSVIILVIKFPREMEPVMSEEKLENGKVEIESVAPYFEAAILAHVEVLEAETLEFADAFGRVVRAAESLDKRFLVCLGPPVHCAYGILKSFGMELRWIEAFVEFALATVLVETERS